MDEKVIQSSDGNTYQRITAGKNPPPEPKPITEQTIQVQPSPPPPPKK